MRTTLTLDDDVAAALTRLCEERHASFKVTVNQALRAGLATLCRARGRPRKPYRMRRTSDSKPLFPDLDNVWDVISHLDEEGSG